MWPGRILSSSGRIVVSVLAPVEDTRSRRPKRDQGPSKTQCLSSLLSPSGSQPLAQRTILDRLSQPVLKQSPRTSETRPPAKTSLPAGLLQLSVLSSGRVSRALGAQKCSPVLPVHGVRISPMRVNDSPCTWSNNSGPHNSGKRTDKFWL